MTIILTTIILTRKLYLVSKLNTFCHELWYYSSYDWDNCSDSQHFWLSKSVFWWKSQTDFAVANDDSLWSYNHNKKSYDHNNFQNRKTYLKFHSSLKEPNTKKSTQILLVVFVLWNILWSILCFGKLLISVIQN